MDIQVLSKVEVKLSKIFDAIFDLSPNIEIVKSGVVLVEDFNKIEISIEETGNIVGELGVERIEVTKDRSKILMMLNKDSDKLEILKKIFPDFIAMFQDKVELILGVDEPYMIEGEFPDIRLKIPESLKQKKRLYEVFLQQEFTSLVGSFAKLEIHFTESSKIVEQDLPSNTEITTLFMNIDLAVSLGLEKGLSYIDDLIKKIMKDFSLKNNSVLNPRFTLLEKDQGTAILEPQNRDAKRLLDKYMLVYKKI